MKWHTGCLQWTAHVLAMWHGGFLVVIELKACCWGRGMLLEHWGVCSVTLISSDHQFYRSVWYLACAGCLGPLPTPFGVCASEVHFTVLRTNLQIWRLPLEFISPLLFCRTSDRRHFGLQGMWQKLHFSSNIWVAAPAQRRLFIQATNFGLFQLPQSFWLNA